jgi:hypothetical protein
VLFVNLLPESELVELLSLLIKGGTFVEVKNQPSNLPRVVVRTSVKRLAAVGTPKKPDLEVIILDLRGHMLPIAQKSCNDRQAGDRVTTPRKNATEKWMSLLVRTTV